MAVSKEGRKKRRKSNVHMAKILLPMAQYIHLYSGRWPMAAIASILLLVDEEDGNGQ